MATKAQREAAAAKRQKVKDLAAQLAAMTPEQQGKIIECTGLVTTMEGRPLSPRNTMLVIHQLQRVSVVGGFRQWIVSGRCVRKGEHGASILVPVGRKGAGTTDSDKDDEETPARPGFAFGTVFDVSQTDPIEATP